MISNTIFSTCGGRLCNQIIINCVSSIVAEKHNLKFIYSNIKECHDKIKKLGIKLFETGTVDHNNFVYLNDDEMIKFMNEIEIKTNFIPNGFMQNDFFAKKLREYFNRNDVKIQIMETNIHKKRYANNNDVIVCVRLDDVKFRSPSFKYFDMILQNLVFENGFITSDEINHPICIKLIEKYKLTPFLKDEIETIMFASTCKTIVLSAGTFNWMIGVLGFFSKVFYPNHDLRERWHPKIYECFDDWTKVDYE